ncbi:DNA photolyase family protein [Ilumatobacteraceae bacterium]|nr:DNA photolyase family protein [Ilumatobacteraceae bacterium]
MTTRPSVLWFRRDLRLVDHQALQRACSNGPVLPLFVVDPAFDHAGERRRAALGEMLQALNRSLGGTLVVRRGDPAQVVADVAAAIGAAEVHVTRDYTPYGHRRDSAVAEVLRAANCRLVGTGTNLVLPPGSVTKDDGGSYSVFTPFRRRWSVYRQTVESPLGSAPVDPDWVELSGEQIGYGGPWGLTPDGVLDDLTMVDTDSASASLRWEMFRSSGLDSYQEMRDRPSVAGTSGLSTALRFGLIHPARLIADLAPGDRDHEIFESELAWRDFYADVLFRRPDSAWRNLDSRLDGIAIDTDRAARDRFERWCSGTTGFPIVDAGMRQLAATGWMHNRVRMITASFLVKDLHLPWQWGARWFLKHLLDGDLASNNHGWQWAAGTGTDAAPYFRVFNPTAQAERFDPDGEYRSRWLPEWRTDRYLAPMVDHAAERAEALRRYEAARSS